MSAPIYIQKTGERKTADSADQWDLSVSARPLFELPVSFVSECHWTSFKAQAIQLFKGRISILDAVWSNGLQPDLKLNWCYHFVTIISSNNIASSYRSGKSIATARISWFSPTVSSLRGRYNCKKQVHSCKEQLKAQTALKETLSFLSVMFWLTLLTSTSRYQEMEKLWMPAWIGSLWYLAEFCCW